MRSPGEYNISRRQFIGAGLLVAAGATGLAVLFGSCNNAPEQPPRITAYIPAWLEATDYQRIGRDIGAAGQQLDRVHLSFATLNQNGRIVEPVISTQLKNLLEKSTPNADLSLAIGGAAVEATAWRAAAANLQQFGQDVNEARSELEEKMQRAVHVDLDCEAVLPANAITGLARAIRSKIPDDRELSLAVPAEDSGRFDTRKGQLGDIVDTFHVMSYDQNGPWNENHQAGPLADGKWVVRTIANWAKKVGGPSRLEVGYPAYAYRYEGAGQSGDTFTTGSYLPFTSIPADAERWDDLQNLTSGAKVEDAWYSYLSVPDIRGISERLHTTYPNLGGSFFWSMDGLTTDHIDAVKP